MWKVLNQSVRGTGHARSDLPCQDAELVARFGMPDAPDAYLVVACSDGAGSASRADEGATMACRAAIEAVSNDLAQEVTLQDVTVEAPSRWVEAVHRALIGIADLADEPPREYACTLLIAVLGHDVTVCVQIGDGAIVRSDGEHCAPVFWPDNGEYANTTTFVTDPRCATLAQVAVLERVDELAVFTDGLQQLALNQATRSAHDPFFLPMFRALRAAERPDDLQVPLRRFLSSEPVNERTDDDKTLVLATRLPV